MKRTLLALSLLATASFIQPALADGEAAEEADGPVSVTLTFTSDYRFRGQSQTSRNAGYQGSIDFEHDSGFFAGVWASNVDFADTGDTHTNVEVDLYAGFNFSMSDATSGSVKATYYYYPDSESVVDYNYLELQVAMSHDFGGASLSGEINYSPEYFFESGSAVAAAVGLEVPLSEKFTASGHLGHQWIEDNGAFGTPDWLYWDVGLSVELGRFTLDARYVDTGLTRAECFVGTNLCSAGFVGTVSLSLP